MKDKMLELVRNYSALNERLSNLMKLKGLTIQQLAKAAGVAVGTIQKLISDPSCNPTISSIEAISRALDVSVSELIGQERISSFNGTNVHLFDWDNVPVIKENLLIHDNKNRETIRTSCPISKNGFALKMGDNSMLPLFPENSILIFDPDKIPKDMNYVLVKIEDHGRVLFKQLLIDEPFKYITSINPLYKENVIKIGPKDDIVAVLVQSQMQY